MMNRRKYSVLTVHCSIFNYKIIEFLIPKKDAISTAIPFVSSEWIITTDADCLVPKNWLSTLDNYIQSSNVNMIAGAVTYDCKNSFLSFPTAGLASLQGATIGSFGIGFYVQRCQLGLQKIIISRTEWFWK
jgi:hypothetical protein